MGFASGVLEWHRPFLSPLYAWTAVMPQGRYVPLPPMVRITLVHLKSRLESGARMVKCLPIGNSEGEVFRTDASADVDSATLGGWEVRDTKDPKKARWFSVVVKCEEVPDLFK